MSNYYKHKNLHCLIHIQVDNNQFLEFRRIRRVLRISFKLLSWQPIRFKLEFRMNLKPNWVFFQKSLRKLFPLTTCDGALGIRRPFVVFAIFSRIIWHWFYWKLYFYYTIWIGVVSGVVNKTKAWLQLLSQYFVTLSSLWQKSLFPDSNIRPENISFKSYDSYVMQHNSCDNFSIDGHN